MRPLPIVLALALSVLGCAAHPPATPPARPASARIDALGWLAGTWRISARGGMVEEAWSAPAGGTMLGTGRVTDGGETRSFEFQRIEQRGANLVLVAQPRGGPATEFVLVELDASHAVFENPAHDFPRRIAYARLAGGVLAIAVEGLEGGVPRSESYTLGLAVPTAPVAASE